MTEAFGFDHAREASDFIGDKLAAKGLATPKISATLGSGLKSFAERYTNRDTRVLIPTGEIPHFARPDAQASGHDGNLIVAPIEDGSTETMAIWAGRIHFYQTLLQKIQDQWTKITDPEVRKAAIVFYVAINRALGVTDIITSNAVGSSNPAHRVGNIVRVSDHMMDPEDDFGVPQDWRWFADRISSGAADPEADYLRDYFFYSQAHLYSKEVFELAQEIMREMGLGELPEGILNWRKGRGYETVAYVQAKTKLGATLFGMSTVPEAQKARSIGFDNALKGKHFTAFSLVTNVAQLEQDQKLSHGEVSQAGAESEGNFNPFMYNLIKRRVAQRKQPS